MLLLTIHKVMIVSISLCNPTPSRVRLYVIHLTIATRPHKAFPKSISPMVQGIEEAPKSPSFGKNLFWKITLHLICFRLHECIGKCTYCMHSI